MPDLARNQISNVNGCLKLSYRKIAVFYRDKFGTLIVGNLSYISVFIACTHMNITFSYISTKTIIKSCPA